MSTGHQVWEAQRYALATAGCVQVIVDRAGDFGVSRATIHRAQADADADGADPPAGLVAGGG